jgi:hypothetical protein
VVKVSEVANADLTRSRDLIVDVSNDRGETWPVLRSPMRFSATSLDIGRAIGFPQALLAPRLAATSFG